MKFKLGQKVKIGGVNGTVIACIGNTFDIRIEDGSLILARGELLTDDQPEVKIEKLVALDLYNRFTEIELNKINELVDFCNAHNSKEYRKIDYGKLRDLAGKISEKDWSQCNDCFDGDHDKCSGGECKCSEHKLRHIHKEDWERQFEQMWYLHDYDPIHKTYTTVGEDVRSFIRKLLEEKKNNALMDEAIKRYNQAKSDGTLDKHFPIIKND